MSLLKNTFVEKAKTARKTLSLASAAAALAFTPISSTSAQQIETTPVAVSPQSIADIEAQTIERSGRVGGIGLAIVYGSNPTIGDPVAFGGRLNKYAQENSLSPAGVPFDLNTVFDPNMQPGAVVFMLSTHGQIVADPVTFETYADLNGLERTMNYAVASYDYVAGYGPRPGSDPETLALAN